MFNLVWIIIMIGANGAPSMMHTRDVATYQSKSACEVQGKAVESRMPDRIRGTLNVGWEVPITVVFQCDPVGDPA